MFNGIAYDNDYNRKIAFQFNELNSKNQNPEPDNFFKYNIGLYGEKMIGGSRDIGLIRQIGGNRPYLNVGVYDRDQKQSQKVVPGVNASMIPYYHQYELNKIDNNLSDYQGGNIFKQAAKGLKKFAKSKIGRKIITKALDVAPGILSTINPVLGSVAKAGRDQLKESTGYGKKGIALYKGDGVKSGGMGPVSGGMCCNTKKGSGVKSGGAGPVSGGAKGGKMKRAELVKKIMKEKSMSLPQASKYVKENNLY